MTLKNGNDLLNIITLVYKIDVSSHLNIVFNDTEQRIKKEIQVFFLHNCPC